MSDLSVSVIIPVYNRKEELLKAIKSVLNQTYLPAEIIVVDDCSNFDVNNFLESNFSESMIKVSVNEVNMGAAKSRNVGINLSKSNYIAFLDSDDFWYEEKLESQISKILLNPELDLVYTDQFLKRNGKLFPSEKVLINERLSEKLITGWTAPNTSTLLFNKKSLLALGGFDDNLPSCQDHDLWFKLAKSNMCVNPYLCLYKNQQIEFLTISKTEWLVWKSFWYYGKIILSTHQGWKPIRVSKQIIFTKQVIQFLLWRLKIENLVVQFIFI